MIIEEQKWTIAPKNDGIFLDFFLKDYYPHLLKYDIEKVCLLRGMIGKSSNEFILISYCKDIISWERYVDSNIPSHEAVLSAESVLLKPISSDVLVSLPPESLKNIYGYREFIIKTKDMDKFVECSERGIWPRVRSQGGKVLGLWANMSKANIARILLLTGYDSVGHWEETRSTNQYGLTFENVSQASVELANQEKTLRNIRENITITTTVNLMKNVFFE